MIGNATVPQGGSITLPIMINNVTGVRSANIILRYDSTVVTVTAIGNSAFGVETYKNISNPGGVNGFWEGMTQYAVSNPEPLNGNVKFADVTLQATATAVVDRKSTRLNSSHNSESRMPSSA
jgi:hypothetical protein